MDNSVEISIDIPEIIKENTEKIIESTEKIIESTEQIIDQTGLIDKFKNIIRIILNSPVECQLLIVFLILFCIFLSSIIILYYFKIIDKSPKLISEKEIKNKIENNIENKNEPEMVKFVSSPTFIGKREGYVFRSGPYGPGYYIDNRS